MKRLSLALLVACGGRAVDPTVVAVGTVDAASSVDASAAEAIAPATPDGLAIVIDDTIHLAGAILNTCPLALPEDDLSRVKQAAASLFADRDELVMRRQNHDDFREHDLRAWTAAAREREASLRDIARRHCRAALP